MDINVFIAISFLLLFGLIIMGVPVPFTFLGVSIFIVLTCDISFTSLIPFGHSKMNSVILLSMPLFTFAGSLMDSGGIGRKLVGAMEKLVYKIPGALGCVNTVTSGVFGALSGSSSATVLAIGGLMAPRMTEAGYKKGFTAALVASAGVLGVLIPPSMIQITYGWASGASVLACFLAIVAPGILACLLMSVQCVLYGKREPAVIAYEAGVRERIESGKKARREHSSVKAAIKTGGKKEHGALAALLMPVLILGSIYGGILTATEAAALSCAYAIPVGLFWYKEMDLKKLWSALSKAGTSTGIMFCNVFCIGLLSRLYTMLNVPQKLVDLLLSVSDNRIIILLMINIFMMILGMIVDDLTGTMLCATLLLPVVQALGMHPVQFAAIVGANLGMGLITPPCAGILYMSGSIVDVDVKEMLPYVIRLIVTCWFPTILITTYVPAFSTALPSLLGYM